jgi:hypothetical protein
MDHTCSKEKEIDKLDKAIFGNGEPGMRTDIALIKQRLESMPTPAQLKFYMVIGGGGGIIVTYVAPVLWKAMIGG